MRRGVEDRGRAGFTLLETLVALAILGSVLLLGMSLVAQQPKVRAKVRAHHEAQAAMASVLEGLRAGTVPVAPGTVTLPTPVVAAEGLVLRLDVSGDPRAPGLTHVALNAHYTVRGQTLRRRIETLLWTGPGGTLPRPAPPSWQSPRGRIP